MLRILPAAIFAFLSVSAASAQVFGVTWVRYQVYPLPGEGNFEVIEGPSAGPQRMWCEAAMSAVQYFGAGAADRLYILNPVGRSKTQRNRYAVGFTLNPSKELLQQANRPGDGGNYSVSVKRVGYNLSVGHAQGFCRKTFFY